MDIKIANWLHWIASFLIGVLCEKASRTWLVSCLEGYRKGSDSCHPTRLSSFSSSTCLRPWSFYYQLVFFVRPASSVFVETLLHAYIIRLKEFSLQICQTVEKKRKFVGLFCFPSYCVLLQLLNIRVEECTQLDTSSEQSFVVNCNYIVCW